MIVIKRVKKDEHIPVDQWDTEANPISDQDRIFRNIKGEIILPIAEFFCDGREESKQLDYFIMNSKRSYNSDEIRMHICKYLNYFERFYDKEFKIGVKKFREYIKKNSKVGVVYIEYPYYLLGKGRKYHYYRW